MQNLLKLQSIQYAFMRLVLGVPYFLTQHNHQHTQKYQKCPPPQTPQKDKRDVKITHLCVACNP